MFLIDANVLIDLAIDDPEWRGWSQAALGRAANLGRIGINPIIYAELGPAFASEDSLSVAISALGVERLALPYAAAFRAGAVHLDYRRRGGSRARVLPDFLIGAHAEVEGLILLTRDPRPYRTYFPKVALITP